MKQTVRRETHLRSAKEVIGYTINGKDEELGRVDDIIIDDEDWKLTYFVLDTGTWLTAGKQTLIATPWINWIYYKDKVVQVDMTREVIEKSPPYDPDEPIKRVYEETLYDYHEKAYPWV